MPEEQMSEEQQIGAFIHRLFHDAPFRAALEADPEGVLEREQVSERVREVLKQMQPHRLRQQLARGEPLPPSSSFMSSLHH